MPTYNYPFSGGVTAVAGYGDRWRISFSGTWAFNEKWTIEVTSDSGDFTLGVGQLNALAATVCSTFKSRVYVGLSSQFNFSENDDPTAWERQSPGAGEIDFLSNFGSQDSIYALSQLQGRLTVLGRRSIQVWSVNADPDLFALVQTLDNVGTKWPLTTQNIGDFDVIFLDDTGPRSLRVLETTLNSTIDDVGAPVDSLVQTDLLTATSACGIVEPTTKNYWLYINGKIYVYSRRQSSRIAAWSQYLPTYPVMGAELTQVDDHDNKSYYTTVVGQLYYWTKGFDATSLVCGDTTLTVSGYFIATSTSTYINYVGTVGPFQYGPIQPVTTTTFTPQKFVVFNGRVYCRSSARTLFLYGGANNITYDGVSAVTVQLPWLDDKRAATLKIGTAIAAVLTGRWTISISMDPQSNNFVTTIPERGSAASPAVKTDSTFDIGIYRVPGLKGTHFSIKAVSTPGVATLPALLSAIVFAYNDGGKP